MIDWIAVNRVLDASFGAGCDLALRATIVLAFAALVTRGMSRATAAARHLVWSAALVGVLLLPVFSMLAPVTIALPAVTRSASPPPVKAIEHPGDPGVGSSTLPQFAAATADLEADAVGEPAMLDAEPTVRPARVAAEPRKVAFLVAATPGAWLVPWRVLAIGVWLAGALLFAVPLVRGCWSLRRLRLKSQPLPAHIEEELQELADGLSVVGLMTAARTMPMTWGLFRSVVLLPAESAMWTAERRRLVLLHELAHVRRHDCLFQMLGQVVRALHWFNPLAWLALNELRLEQEQASDDVVLNAGTDADEYAGELLMVSARLPRSMWDAGTETKGCESAGFESTGSESAVALAMSRVTRLEHRIKAILNMNSNRLPLSLRTVALSLTLLGGFVCGVAGVQWQEAQARSPVVPALATATAAPAPAVIKGASSSPVALAMADPVAADAKASGEQAGQAVAGPPAAAPAAGGGTVANPGTPQPAAAGNDAAGGKLVDVLKKIEAFSAVEVDPTTLNEAAIRGMLGSLKDPYSTFITAAELKELHTHIDGQLVGIGTALSREKDVTTVINVLPNSPALKGGLKVGDVILAVNGEAVGSLEDTVKKVRGPVGSEVWLKIRRDQTESILSLKRDTIQISAVRGLSMDAEGHWQHWLDAPQKIAYIQLTEFNRAAVEDLKAALKTLKEQGLKGLVLDLRGNPGGLLNGTVEAAQLFLKEGMIVQTKGRTAESSWSFKAGADAPYADLPLILVVDNRTASAGEVLTAALQDNGRAIVVGERTFGKGSVQSIIPLENDTTGPAVRLTTAQMLTPKGRAWSRMADSKDWGLDPNDGYFIPLTTEQRMARHGKRAGRERGSVKVAEPLTPESVEQELADPALAAAFKAMASKVAGGEFAKTGKPLADQQSQFSRSDELRKERDELKKKLEQVERELVQ